VNVAHYLPEQAAAAGKEGHVALGWALDLLFSKDLVPLKTDQSRNYVRAVETGRKSAA